MSGPHWRKKPSTPTPHGTSGGYTNHHCRCQFCRDAFAAQMRVYRKKIRNRPIPAHVHGTTNGYQNYGCRCSHCTAASTLRSAMRKRKREAA